MENGKRRDLERTRPPLLNVVWRVTSHGNSGVSRSTQLDQLHFDSCGGWFPIQFVQEIVSGSADGLGASLVHFVRHTIMTGKLEQVFQQQRPYVYQSLVYCVHVRNRLALE